MKNKAKRMAASACKGGSARNLVSHLCWVARLLSGVRLFRHITQFFSHRAAKPGGFLRPGNGALHAADGIGFGKNGRDTNGF